MNIAWRDITVDDLSLLLRWRNENREWFGDSRKLTKEEHAAWFARYDDEYDQDTAVTSIVDNESGVYIGCLSIYNIRGPTAEIGRIVVDKPYRRLGYATQMVKEAMIWASMRYGVHSFHLTVKGDNHAAIAVYRKCGFVEGGSFGDVLMMVSGGCDDQSSARGTS